MKEFKINKGDYVELSKLTDEQHKEFYDLCVNEHKSYDKLEVPTSWYLLGVDEQGDTIYYNESGYFEGIGVTSKDITDTFLAREEYERELAKTNTVQWYDYDKQESISLPPVGVECEVIYQLDDSPKWECGMVIGKSNYNKDLVFEFKSGGVSFVTSDSEFRPLDWNKNKERDEFIKKSRNSLKEWNSLEDIFNHQYNAGARFND